MQIRSTIKYGNNGCTRSEKDPQYTAENVLNRKFRADAPNEKWVTDVTEFKWYEGLTVHKLYLSAILDLNPYSTATEASNTPTISSTKN